MHACLSYFLSCHCNKMLWQTKSKKRGFTLVHEGTVHPAREIKVTGAWGRGIIAWISLPCSSVGKMIRKVCASFWWFYSLPWQDTQGEDLEGKGFTLSHSLSIMVGKAWSLEHHTAGHLHLHPQHEDKWMLGFISHYPSHSVTKTMGL